MLLRTPSVRSAAARPCGRAARSRPACARRSPDAPRQAGAKAQPLLAPCPRLRRSVAARIQQPPAASGGDSVAVAVTIPDRVPATLLPQPVPPTLPPNKVFEAAVNISVTKAGYTWQKVAVLSFMAGIQISLGALLMTVVGGGSPAFTAANPGLGKWLHGAIGLPTGLAMVILTGSELFTGNVFYFLAGWLSKKVTASQLALNWAVSFAGNFAGSLAVVALVYVAGTTAVQPWLGTTLSVAAYKSSLPFATAFTRGILCNWMVCTAVWIATASQSAAGKFLGIWLLVSSFVAMGFEHSIANMFLIPLGILNGAAVSPATFLLSNLLPVTLGNIVGGGILLGSATFIAYGERPQ